MRAFVEMRYFLADNARILERISAVEQKHMEPQRTTDERFELEDKALIAAVLEKLTESSFPTHEK